MIGIEKGEVTEMFGKKMNDFRGKMSDFRDGWRNKRVKH